MEITVKNRLIFSFAGMFCLFTSIFYGLPVLNPGAPALLTEGMVWAERGDCWGVKVGYRGDFVYNKLFKDLLSDSINQFGIYNNEGVLTLNLWNRIDIYGYVGASNIDFRMIAEDSGENLIVSTRTRTVGGVGIKAILWQSVWDCYGTSYIGIDGQYEWTDRFPWSRGTLSGAELNVGAFSSKFEEGQIAVGVGHKIHFFVPYIAVRWSTAKSPFVYFETDTMKSRRHFGYAVGASIVDIGSVNVTAEARFLTETALSLCADIRF
ncbi:MAG: hypothetical protein P4L16_00435 [Chlamydiales bacterium]|nr:hypothetical protein [Chlamydiales bacterium]